MEQLRGFWRDMTLGKRVTIVGATLSVVIGMMMFGLLGNSRADGLLYSGLDASAAGDVVAALEAQGAAYEVRGSSIYVETAQRDRLRMTLASAGLPALGDKGYELLDSLSGFGTTSQMFDAAYWRAKEGELARTIVAAPHIKSARVHISATAARAFQKDVSPTAAVTVGTVSGGLTAEQARALRFLVAAAVSGMSPKDVSIIDKVAGLIASGDPASNQIGDDPRVDAMKAKVERLMEARVGFGNAVVEVSVETTTESARITETTFDPESRVAISTEIEERSSSSENGDNGQVTVASNLPDGDGAESSGNSSAKVAETHERTNFEVSETRREITKGPGDIRRLTVAVLVNSNLGTGPDGTPLEERSEEELNALRSLVETAVGYDEARGDIVTLQSLAFEPITEQGSVAIAADSIWSRVNATQLIQYAIIALVLVVFAIFVFRPMLASSATASPTLNDVSMDVDAALPELESDAPAFPELEFAAPEEMSGFDTISDFGDAMGGEDTPSDRLQALLSDRRNETLQVLRSWLDTDAEQASEV